MSAPRDAISPLPNELLEAIAAAGQEGRTQDGVHTFDNVPFKSEWILSHVSHRFRDVILGAPALWTLIETDFGAQGSVEILKLYLERSRSRSISAVLRRRRMGPVVPKDTRDLVVGRVGLIVKHINRIWRLSIEVRLDCMEVLIPFRDVAAPTLRRLEIVKADSDLPAWDSIEVFSAAPALTFVKIDGLKPRLPVPAWTTSLTHLELWNGQDLDDQAVPILASITGQCPSLIHLYLDIEWMHHTEHRLHIPSLKNLHVSISSFPPQASDYLLEMVHLFDTPSLTKFVVNNARCDQIWHLSNTTNLPRAFFPALTSFSLVNGGVCPCKDKYLPDVPYRSISSQKNFPPLSSLTLVNQCFTATFVEDVLGPASQWFLKTITLCPQDIFVDDVCDALQDGIRSKRQLGNAVPIFKLSPELFSLVQANGEADGADVELEIFDPVKLISSLDRKAEQMVWSSRTEDIY
ncbi:hypothetical protein C8R45DRAFT_956646 [Mycena sanguinolenta]|nr:hypothetical protein C8R45DRAFT_956646 [Mycena sanguinolenta]